MNSKDFGRNGKNQSNSRMNTLNRIFRILVVEGNREDQLLFSIALKRLGQPVDVRYASNGVEAVTTIEAAIQRDRSSIPSLIITDLRMPCMDGFDFLIWRQSHILISKIPTVVMSTSTLQDEVAKAHALGANAFLQKPVCLNELVTTVAKMIAFWKLAETGRD